MGVWFFFRLEGRNDLSFLDCDLNFVAETHLRLALATQKHSAPQVHEAYDGLHNRYETLPSPGLFLNRPWMAMLSALKIMYHLEVSIVMVPQARWMVLTGHSIYG